MRRVGLIGFGSIAEHGHLPALQSFNSVRVAAIADLSAERLRLAAEAAPGVELFDSPAALIEQGEIDILDICSPPSTHARLIEKACERGIPTVVSEKPFVLSVAELHAVERARLRSGCRVVCVNNWMSSDLNQTVGGVLSSGEIGAVRKVELRTGRPDAARGHAGWMPHWRTDLSHAGGGIILDHGWHQLYLLLGWMDQPLQEVTAVVRTLDQRHAPVEDDAVIDLFFPAGYGRIELSWTAGERRNDGRIVGTDGEIAVHDDRIVVHNKGGQREILFHDRLTQSSYHPDWFEEFFRYTVLDSDSEAAERNFAQAALLVRTIDALYRSGRAGGIRVHLEHAGQTALRGTGEEAGSAHGRGGLSGPPA